MATTKSYQVNGALIKKTLKNCDAYMTTINDTIGKYGDGASGAKTLIGAIERMNEKCWSDGKYATTWYNDNQNDLNDVHGKLKAINESLETLDLIENIN